MKPLHCVCFIQEFFHKTGWFFHENYNSYFFQQLCDRDKQFQFDHIIVLCFCEMIIIFTWIYKT